MEEFTIVNDHDSDYDSDTVLSMEKNRDETWLSLKTNKDFLNSKNQVGEAESADITRCFNSVLLNDGLIDSPIYEMIEAVHGYLMTYREEGIMVDRAAIRIKFASHVGEETINHLLAVKRFSLECGRTGSSHAAELVDLTIKDGKLATLFIRGPYHLNARDIETCLHKQWEDNKAFEKLGLPSIKYTMQAFIGRTTRVRNTTLMTVVHPPEGYNDPCNQALSKASIKADIKFFGSVQVEKAVNINIRSPD
eukprot:7977658-Pyramimonas_sp.AAC.1